MKDWLSFLVLPGEEERFGTWSTGSVFSLLM